jgi:hypothetical protein
MMRCSNRKMARFKRKTLLPVIRAQLLHDETLSWVGRSRDLLLGDNLIVATDKRILRGIRQGARKNSLRFAVLWERSAKETVPMLTSVVSTHLQPGEELDWVDTKGPTHVPQALIAAMLGVWVLALLLSRFGFVNLHQTFVLLALGIPFSWILARRGPTGVAVTNRRVLLLERDIKGEKNWHVRRVRADVFDTWILDSSANGSGEFE